MKLSQSERVELYGQILAALLPLKLKTTPPARNGQPKPANWQFATATWARRVLSTAEYVLEREDNAGASSPDPTTTPAAGGSDAPF